MEIKNEALKSLYEELVSCIFPFGLYGVDQINPLFKKCDDELEKLQRNIKTFQQSNGDLLAANLDLATENKQLKDKCYDLDRSHKRLGDIRNRLAKENEDLKQQNKKLGEKCREEVKDREHWRQLCNERGDRIRSLDNEKEDLRKQLDSLNTAMGRLRERYEEEAVCRRKWAKLAGYRDERIEELLKTGYWIDTDEVYKLKGMEELWAMLGTMYAADPIEVSKIFGWFSINNIAHYTPDVREFLKKYETWKSGKDEKEEEQKRLDYMRDYLHRFCVGKVCYGCPLHTPDFKCGEGFGFN